MANTAVIVGYSGTILKASLIGAACKKYPACYGLAIVMEDDVVIEKGNFSEDESIESRATRLFNKTTEFKDHLKVLWVSKEPVPANSLQPFVVQEQEVSEEGKPEPLVVTNIASVLYGDYGPSKHDDGIETGEFYANEDTLKPTIVEILEECKGDIDSFAQRIKAEEQTISNNLCDNNDCGCIIITFDGHAYALIKASEGEGKVVDGYFMSDPSLLVDPTSSTGIAANTGGKKRRTLGSGSTVREPVSVKGAEEIAAQSGGKIHVIPTPKIVKAKTPAWACGNNESQKKWFRACNQVRDYNGLGVVPSDWRDKPDISVDERVLKATNHNELALIIKSFDIPPARPATATAIPANAGKTSPPNVPFVKTTSAAEKQALMDGWVKAKLVNGTPRSAADIQAEEKELPSFKTITGYGLGDLKQKAFEDLFELITKHPKTATQALWDALHRNPPAGMAAVVPTVPQENPNKKKRRIGAH